MDRVLVLDMFRGLGAPVGRWVEHWVVSELSDRRMEVGVKGTVFPDEFGELTRRGVAVRLGTVFGGVRVKKSGGPTYRFSEEGMERLIPAFNVRIEEVAPSLQIERSGPYRAYRCDDESRAFVSPASVNFCRMLNSILRNGKNGTGDNGTGS